MSTTTHFTDTQFLQKIKQDEDRFSRHLSLPESQKNSTENSVNLASYGSGLGRWLGLSKSDGPIKIDFYRSNYDFISGFYRAVATAT
jgi:hypothetical protein